MNKKESNLITDTSREEFETNIKNLKNGQTNKKLILTIFITIALIIFLITISILIFRNIIQIKNFEKSILSFVEKNEKTIFSINKITFFSSSDSKNKTSSATNFTVENLYTYTDIALFVNNNSNENSTENTLKNVKISNINYTTSPLIGQPNLYYKSINDFAKSGLNEDNIILNELDFNITSENEADLTKPTLYNNCANPITISCINQNVKTDYTILDTKSPITYNGSLLKRCDVDLNSIKCSIKFDINIENNKNQKFISTVYIDIPYEQADKSIYDGSLILKKDTNFNFYRYE